MGYFSPIIRKFLAENQHYATGRLLDVGCGDKPYCYEFKNIDIYVGIDIPPEIDIMRPNQGQRIRSIDVFAQATSLPFPDESFDTVLSTQMIAHITDPFMFMEEISRVLRPSGCLIITYPMVSPLAEVPHDYLRYTEFGLESLCNRFNISVLRHERMGGGWLTIAFLMRNFLFRNQEKSEGRLQQWLFRKAGKLSYSFFSKMDQINDQPLIPLNYLTIAQKD